MSRPRPYYVSQADDTKEAHRPGWYWCEFTDDDGPDYVHGPFSSRRGAEDAIDQWMFDQGKVPC